MKKIIFSILLLFYPLIAMAETIDVDLSLGNIYLLMVNEPNAIISVFKSNVISAEKMNTLGNDKLQIIVKTLNIGQTGLEILGTDETIRYNINVVEEQLPLTGDFIEIDKPYRELLEK